MSPTTFDLDAALYERLQSLNEGVQELQSLTDPQTYVRFAAVLVGNECVEVRDALDVAQDTLKQRHLALRDWVTNDWLPFVEQPDVLNLAHWECRAKGNAYLPARTKDAISYTCQAMTHLDACIRAGKEDPQEVPQDG